MVKASDWDAWPVFVAGSLICLASLVLPAAALALTIVLNNGKHIDVKSYKVQGQLLMLELQNGSAQAYALRDVNLTATQAANAQSTAAEVAASEASAPGVQQRSTSPSGLRSAQPTAGQEAGAPQSKAWAGELKITPPPEGRVVIVGPTPSIDLTPAPSTKAAAAPDAEAVELNSATTATPTPSRRQLAAQRFDEDIAALAERAADYVDKVRQYDDACYGKSTFGTAEGGGYGAAAGRFRGGGSRIDFVSAFAYTGSWTVAIDNESTPFCRALWSDISSLGPSIDKAKTEAIERARRGGAWPGDVRSALHKYGIQWDKGISQK